MLEKEILKIPEFQKNPAKLSKYNFKNEETLHNYIKKLPTIQKICIVQNLLKEMVSIKDRFDDNKQEIIDKMDSNSFKYFKNSILIKQIYDYCESSSLEVPLDYSLSKDKIEELYKFEEENKTFVTDFFFELRNDNSLMLNIIEQISKDYYEQLCYFMVHFLYGNPTSNSLGQDELIMITYLILENLICNKYPDDLSIEEIMAIDFEESKKGTFIYYYLLALTRKVEIRNYISSILHDNIIKLENSQKISELNIKKIYESMTKEKNKKEMTKKNSTSNLQRKGNINGGSLKDQILMHQSTLLTRVSDTIKSNVPINNNYNNNTQKMRYSTNLVNTNTLKNKDNNIDSNENNSNNLNINDKLKNEYFDSFFKENDFNRIMISKKLAELNDKKRDENEDAYMEILKFLQNQYHNKNTDIYSNSMITKAFKNNKMNIKKFNMEEISNIYIDNFNMIIEFVEEVLDKINDNIKSIPYMIKCMLYIINILVEKKFVGRQVNSSVIYQKFMLKLRFFLGGFFFPILGNPIYNGIVTDSIISNDTKENLDIILKVFSKFISGNLFNEFEPTYSIFNKFIIEKLPFLFNMIKNIDKEINANFEPPIVIKNLLESNSQIKSKSRNINYNYFDINENDNIRYQSICFSFSDLMMFINTFEEMKNMPIKKDSNLFLLLKYKKIFNERHLQDMQENKKGYIFLTKFSYREAFLKEIKSVTEDHFDIYFKNQKNNNNVTEEINRIKKCLIKVLIYINKLHKEFFNTFIRRKDGLTLNQNSEINKLSKYRRMIYYIETYFEGDKRYSVGSLNDPILRRKTVKKALAEDTSEDADFLKEIFPKVIELIKYEIGENYTNQKLEKIIFCISYLQITIRKLPDDYINNNFSNLFFDLMLDIEKLIKSLQNNILNQFYLKLREGDKLNLLISNYSSQIKNLEKFVCVKYLFNHLSINDPFGSEIKFENAQTFTATKINSILTQSSITDFILNFPDYRKNEREIDDIIEEENKNDLPNILKKLFKEIKNNIKNEKIILKFSPIESSSICYELENYILFRLHEKIFPRFPSKKDEFIYKKCRRLSFIKPENYIKEKNMINEKLLESAMEYINDMDKMLTPLDKIKTFGQAFQILQNSMKFSSGKSDLGIDDILPLVIYVILKSQPKKINTNYNFCKNYINPELNKKEYGLLLMQIGMAIKVINDMKYTDLINVTEEQFGNDYEPPPNFRRSKNLQGNININN